MEDIRLVVEDIRLVVEDVRLVVEDIRLVVEDIRLVVEDIRLVVEDIRLVVEDIRLVVEDVRLVVEDIRLVVEDVRLVVEDIRLVVEDVRLVVEDIRLVVEDIRLVVEDIRLVVENDRHVIRMPSGRAPYKAKLRKVRFELRAVSNWRTLEATKGLSMLSNRHVLLFTCAIAAALATAAACGQTPATSDAGADSGIGTDSAADVVTADTAAEAGCPTSTDYTADPANCGTCGHSCLGGVCSASKCQPFVVNPAASDQTPLAITVDATGAYWVDQGWYPNYLGGVQYLSNTASAPVALATNQNAPSAIATDGVSIFFENYGTQATSFQWNGDSTIIQCPVAGCPTTPHIAYRFPDAGITPSYVYSQMAASTTNAYWVVGKDIYTIQEGADAATVFSMNSATANEAMTADSTSLYWGRSITDSKKFSASFLAQLDPGGTGTILQLAVGPSAVFAERNKATSEESWAARFQVAVVAFRS